MKSFQPEKIKEANQEQLAKDILRTQIVKKELTKAQTELDDANARFEVALSTQRARWSQEEEKANEQLLSLRKEVIHLEKRRENALIPIDSLKKEADTLIKEARSIFAKAGAKQTELETLADALTKRLDEVSDKEIDLKEKIQFTNVREQSTNNQFETVKKLSQQLNQKWEEYFVERETQTNKYQDALRAIELREISVKTREADLETRKQDLYKEKNYIKSQYAALQAALNEHRGKSIT